MDFSPTTFINSVLYYNTAVVAPNYWDGGAIHYSCTTPLPTSGNGNITNAPLFADAAVRDFRLQSNSPCINAGRHLYCHPGLDLDGHPRISRGTVDIGAYEFQSPQSVLSYAWLQHHGLPIDASADFTDSDGDGHNNWQEWRASTDPMNATSALRLLSPLVGIDAVFVGWQSVDGQRYRIERGKDFGQGILETIASNIVGQPA